MQLLQSAGKTSRMIRSPSHTFNVRNVPFAIQPIMIAPVLPGETMKNLLLQARAVTMPIKNPLTGWWLEYYFFYVKHRDLDMRDDLTEMVLDLNKDMSAYNTAAALRYYHGAGKINYAYYCLKRVVEEYFRDEGEAWNAYIMDGLPMCAINSENILNSAILAADFVNPDFNADLNADGDVTASEIDQTLRNWQFLKANNLTDMSYEDYLGTYGVRPRPEESHVPELIRYVREWQYPTNTVNPANGTPSTAVSWSIAERADKDRFFREPGFIFGVTIARPKVYLRVQDGSIVDSMTDALSWLPAILKEDPLTSLKKFAETEGPFSVVSDADGYWLDMKDLFLYGDQFLNYSPTGVTNASLVDLPLATLQGKYPDADDVAALFVTGTDNYVRQDGIISLKIASSLRDTTP